jgi:SAM-dependent methyltransferase
MRGLLLDEDLLLRAVASGRQKGGRPRWRRVELRYVDLKAGRRLQVTAYDDTQAHTSNHDPGEAAREAVDALLDEPFGNWHVETTTETHQLRVTKKLEAMVHTAVRGAVEPGESAGGAASPEPGDGPARAHDRRKPRLLPEDHPVLRAVGIADADGRVKPSKQAKYRQVEEFLRLLDASLSEAIAQGRVRTPTPEDPLRIVDLGCGNAYLTFAAHAFLSQRLPVRMTGIDVKEQSAEHNSAVAARLGIDADFVVGTIGGARLGQAPDVVLALHACDTATGDALARALEWKASLVLAAPCCHHDIAAQLRTTQAPEPYAMLTRHGILRERFADTLTDALRATLLRREGYRVDVVEFVESAHTPRNTLLRAVRTEGGSDAAAREYDDLVATWRVRPRLGELLGRP